MQLPWPSPFWDARCWLLRLPIALASAGARSFSSSGWGAILFGREERFDSPKRRGATEQATPWRGLLVGGVGAGTDGGFRQSDDPGSHCVQSQLPAIASFPVSGPALVGVAGNVSAGGGAWWRIALAGRMRRAAAVHLFSSAFHTPFLFLLLWLKLSAAP